MSKFAIFIALPEELEAAITLLNDRGRLDGSMIDVEAGQRQLDYELFYDSQIIEGSVYLIRGMGNTKSAAFVGSSLFAEAPPRHALLVGISGSLNKDKIKLGDVVISSHVKHYSPDKIKCFTNAQLVEIDVKSAEEICDPLSSVQLSNFTVPGKTLIDGRDRVLGDSYFRYLRETIMRPVEQKELKRFLRKRIDKFGNSGGNGFSVHHGSLLGSHMVIDSESYVNYIHQKNMCSDTDYYQMNSPDEFRERCKWDQSELLAVDMESYGFFAAYEDYKYYSGSVRATAFRGISDLAFGKSDLDKESKGKHRRSAVQNALNVALDYLCEQSDNQIFNSR